MSVWEKSETYETGDIIQSGGIFYICQRHTGMPKFIRKIPVTHGPIRKRGKGKVNRDWER